MLTLREAAEAIRNRRRSPVELVQECLGSIETLNATLNAFITITADRAVEEARRAESEIASGKYRGPLHGIPLGLKDLFDTKGVRTTAASNQYRDRVPGRDAEVVRRLKDAGAIILGKTNMHEFAFGMSGVVSAFGPARNPWDTSRITGGSSSGSAAALASGMCVAALGSDTAGSNRCPPSLCGLVGYRPSEGWVSTAGVVPLSTSFDTVGPMTRTVEDAALLLDVMSGGSITSELHSKVSQLKLGVARAHFCEELHPDVAAAFEQALHVLRGLVAEEHEIQVPVDGFRTIFDAEIYEFHEAMAKDTPELYDPRTLYRVQKCAGIEATDYIRERRRVVQFRKDAERIFEQVDVVVTPTVPVPAPTIDELERLDIPDVRPFEVKYLLRNTAAFSALYWPSISVPCGFSTEGLPIGMQLSARPGSDAVLFRLADAYQRETDWHQRRPPLG